MYIWPPIPQDPCKKCIVQACCNFKDNRGKRDTWWQIACEPCYNYAVHGQWNKNSAKSKRIDTLLYGGILLLIITFTLLGVNL